MTVAHDPAECQRLVADTRRDGVRLTGVLMRALADQLEAACAEVERLRKLRPRSPATCQCTYEHGDSDCSVHPTCPGCGESLCSTEIAAEIDTLRAEVERKEADIGNYRAVNDSLSQQLEAARKEISSLEKRPLRTFDRIGADRLADEVCVLVDRKVIDSRSPAADALLDYREPPRSERSERIVDLERDLSAAQRRIAELEADGQRGCSVHGGEVHGGEAEELRKGVEKILEAVPEHLKDVRRKLVELLDRVDARDSLAHLELTDERDSLKARVAELETAPKGAERDLAAAQRRIAELEEHSDSYRDRSQQLAVRIAELESIVQQTQGVHVSWVDWVERDRQARKRIAELESSRARAVTSAVDTALGEVARQQGAWERDNLTAALRAIMPVYRSAVEWIIGGRNRQGFVTAVHAAGMRITPEIARLMAEMEKS